MIDNAFDRGTHAYKELVKALKEAKKADTDNKEKYDQAIAFANEAIEFGTTVAMAADVLKNGSKPKAEAPKKTEPNKAKEKEVESKTDVVEAVKPAESADDLFDF